MHFVQITRRMGHLLPHREMLQSRYTRGIPSAIDQSARHALFTSWTNSTHTVIAINILAWTTLIIISAILGVAIFEATAGPEKGIVLAHRASRRVDL